MELKEILTILESPEKVIDPQQANIISSYLSGYITDLEETINELNYQVSVKHYELLKETKKISHADRMIELEPIYQTREKQKLTLSQLKRLRADMRDRFQILTSVKRF